jgi:enoyl-CoA hydratase/carnithine racemase
MEYRDLLYDVHGHVATVTLNRPDRLNAISTAMLESFSRALQAAHEDSSVRVIVISGAGKGFCAGLDMKDQAAGQGVGAGGFRFDLGSAPPVVLHQLDKPVICALNGAAAGYGLDLALGCDLRIASEDAKLAAVFTKRGVLPESGGSWLLPRLVGWARAAEIAFLGKVLSAREAFDLGLVNKVVPREALASETAAWADEIAGNAPLAVQATKRMMRLGLTETFEANVHHVFLQLLPLFASRDFREGMAAFLEKRAPRFTGT